MEYGIGVKMITGDHLLIALETARQLDMGTQIHTAVNLPMLQKDGKALSFPLSLKCDSILPCARESPPGFDEVRRFGSSR